MWGLFIYFILKALWIILSETINILRNLQKKIFFTPQEFYHYVHSYIHVAPSSDHLLLKLTLSF